MRINLLRKNLNVGGMFFQSTIKDFAEHYDFTTIKVARDYVMAGKQGLKAYVAWLREQGYRCEMYALEPNRDLFLDMGDQYTSLSRFSPSFGLIMADDCPMWVEFKLKNM
jgi:hypothetical protein